MWQKSKTVKALLFCAFILYALAMLWLLFVRNRSYAGGNYWQQIGMHMSLVPFRTIRQYLRALIQNPNPYEAPAVFINLIGNIAVFVPLGLLTPYLWKKLETFNRFLLYIVVLILAIELVQLFTLRGICDIDDLILNVLGACIGFAILRAIRKKRSART